MVLFSCLHVPSNSQKKIIVFFLSIEKQQRRVCKWRHSKKRNNNWIIFKFRVWQLEELPFPLYIFYRSSGNPHVLWSWPLANLSSLPLPHRAASLMACTHMAARKTNQLSQSQRYWNRRFAIPGFLPDACAPWKTGFSSFSHQVTSKFFS